MPGKCCINYTMPLGLIALNIINKNNEDKTTVKNSKIIKKNIRHKAHINSLLENYFAYDFHLVQIYG